MTLKEWLKDFLYSLKINEVKLNYTKDMIYKIYNKLEDIEYKLNNKETKDETDSNAR